MASSITRWRSQHVLHKLGAVGVLLATLLFIVGFSVPAWATHFGLWMSCSSKSCSSNLHSHSDGWMTAVRVTECIALLAYVLCCLMVILHDCFLYRVRLPYIRIAEILGGAAGMTSITGAIVFGICWSKNKTVFISPGSDSLQDDQALSLHWGFGLVITASVIVLLSAIAIRFSRHKQERSMFPSKNMPDPKTDGGDLIDEGVTFQHFQGPDSSSMMLVPASHFDTSKPVTRQTSDPPPYALPPPYPYRSTRDVFLPIASSSPMTAHTSDTTSMGGLSQGTSGPNQPLTNTDRVLATPPQNFITSASTFCMQSQPPVMRPLFIKTSDGGSEIEITPSAQNSSGLPSPFNHF